MEIYDCIEKDGTDHIYADGRTKLVGPEAAEKLHVPCKALCVARCRVRDGDKGVEIDLKKAPGEDFFADLQAAGWQKQELSCRPGDEHVLYKPELYESVQDGRVWHLRFDARENEIVVEDYAEAVDVRKVASDLRLPYETLQRKVDLCSVSATKEFCVRFREPLTEDLCREMETMGWQRLEKHLFLRREAANTVYLVRFDEKMRNMWSFIRKDEVTAQWAEKKYGIPCHGIQALAFFSDEEGTCLNVYGVALQMPDFERDLLAAEWEKQNDGFYTRTSADGRFRYTMMYNEDSAHLEVLRAVREDVRSEPFRE